jgi:hypothetical protein
LHVHPCSIPQGRRPDSVLHEIRDTLLGRFPGRETRTRQRARRYPIHPGRPPICARCPRQRGTTAAAGWPATDSRRGRNDRQMADGRQDRSRRYHTAFMWDLREVRNDLRRLRAPRWQSDGSPVSAGVHGADL